jgi:hypothetical protein
MAAGDTTQGKRLPDGTGIKGALFEPGCYQKVTIDGETHWYARPPRSGIGNLSAHTITEHEDGTITASPSILIHDTPDEQGWHGYLERGIWREV